jgi:hypothetical protein
MKAIADEKLHYEHTRVLAAQLIADTVEVLEQYGLFTRDQNRDITKDLVFRLCAVLDGSSYPGTLNEEEIAPFVGFYLDHDTDNALISENGSGMHAFIEELVDEHYLRSKGA